MEYGNDIFLKLKDFSETASAYPTTRSKQQVLLDFFSNLELKTEIFQTMQTDMLWENYFPGDKSIQARFSRVKYLLKQQNLRRGLPANFVPKGRKSAADPVQFCRKNFPPVSYSDQDEFHACLTALKVPQVQLEAGESTQATDIIGTPAGRNQPDGPNSLSPGSSGWSRW